MKSTTAVDLFLRAMYHFSDLHEMKPYDTFSSKIVCYVRNSLTHSAFQSSTELASLITVRYKTSTESNDHFNQDKTQSQKHAERKLA